MRKIFFVLLSFSTCLHSFTQQFGGNPVSLRWKQINTDSVKVVFPYGLDSQAQRVASVVHYLAAEKPFSLGDRLKKVSIVLQNQTTIANGYVQMGPFRSEFFLTPDPMNFSQGSISWTDQLALHEYRHVQQFNNFHNGLSKLMKTLFGEDGYTLAINASIPDWFYEGDAVYQETALSKQGRGRLPLFMNTYPSLWQAGKKYSWMKLRNGSLKDYVPNHYNLGYLLVNYGYEKYGKDFWQKVTHDASAFKGLFYPFQTAIKKHTGLDYASFRKQAFEHYKKNIVNIPAGQASYLLPVKKDYVTNYSFPYNAGEDSLIYLKTSYRQRPVFYIKDKEGEHRLRAKDISIDDQFSYRNGKIVYSAYESDPRWGWRDYGVIKMLDIATGRQMAITKKSKYFTPDISNDGSKVVAVQNNTDGRSELHVINVADGSIIRKFHSAEIMVFTDPKYMDSDNIVTAVRLRDGRMTLASAEIASGNLMRLLPPSFNVVGYPSVKNNIIYFTANFGGNDDVYALQVSDKKIFKVTNGPLGNYFVNAGDGKLTWSAFTAEGYQLQQIDVKQILWQEVTPAVTETVVEKFPVNGFDSPGDILMRKVINKNFPVSDYKKSAKLLNFHSWRPYYADPIFTFSLYGENVLNTLQTELYYLYNENERTSAAGISMIYGAMFPFLSAGTEYTFGRSDIIGNRVRYWDQLDTRVGLSIPLNYSKGQTFRNFNLSSNYVLRNEFNKGFFKDSAGNSSFSYLLHTISWTQQIQRAVQHIFPKFAYSVSANHRHAINSFTGYQFIANAALYTPGLLNNHNLVITGSFQQRDTLAQVVFASRFGYSRGYEGRYFSRMWRLSANYHFPIWHPDWGFGNILYLQRIRANAFYDFTKVYSRDKTQTRDQRSVGGEVFVDTKWWNQYPLSFGFRVSRLLDRDQLDGFKGTVFELVLPVSIIPR
jgi:hypothetical protein